MKRILCYGDSNTWGFNPHGNDEVSGAHLRYGEDVRWTARVARLLSCHGAGGGVNGRTAVFDDPTSEGRNCLLHLCPILLSCDPVDAVVVMLGTNDVKDMFSAPALNISEGLERLVRHLRVLLSGSLSHRKNPGLISPIALTAGADGAYFYGFSADSTRKISELAPLGAGRRRAARLRVSGRFTLCRARSHRRRASRAGRPRRSRRGRRRRPALASLSFSQRLNAIIVPLATTAAAKRPVGCSKIPFRRHMRAS